MGAINRVPLGLLSLLDSQTQGKYPDSFGELIAPTFDMAQLLAASRRYETASNVSGGVGSISNNNASVFVPNGEVWLVRNITSGAFALEAGLNYGIAAQYQDSLSIDLVTLAAQAVTNINSVGANLQVTANFSNWFFAVGGNVFSTAVTNIVGSPVLGADISTTVNFCRLRV